MIESPPPRTLTKLIHSRGEIRSILHSRGYATESWGNNVAIFKNREFLGILKPTKLEPVYLEKDMIEIMKLGI